MNELIRELVEALEYSSDFLSRSASRFDDVIETLAKAHAYLETGGWTRVRLVKEHENEALRKDAERYRWLRSRDLDTIDKGGVFAGMTPRNIVLNEEHLDTAIDAALKEQSKC